VQRCTFSPYDDRLADRPELLFLVHNLGWRANKEPVCVDRGLIFFDVSCAVLARNTPMF